MTVNVNDLRCSTSHEYVLQVGDETYIGITQYAVDQLGDVTYVEMPEIGKTYNQGEIFGTIESVKAASELYMPVHCTVLAVNESLESNPEYMNDDPYAKGWILKVTSIDCDQLNTLLTYSEYLKSVEG